MSCAMASEFSRIMQDLDYPMVIATAAVGAERAGCLVGFCTQVSIDPERFLVCISNKNHTHGVALRAEGLAVHVIPGDRVDLAETFGSQTDDTPGDKLDELPWRAGPHGAPILDACGNWFAGAILDRRPFGDHTGFLIEPEEAAHDPGEAPGLGFAVAQHLRPGHRP